MWSELISACAKFVRRSCRIFHLIRAMKIVAEYEIRESEVEVLEENTRGGNGRGCVARYSPRVLDFVGVAIE